MAKDFENDSWEMFLKDMEGRKLYIWGAGYKGKEVIEKHASKWDIVGFVDNDASLKEFAGYTVYHPEDLKEDGDTYCILISPVHPEETAEQVHEMGIRRYYSYFWMNRKEWALLLQKNMDEEKIESVKAILADEKSRLTMDRIAEKRRSCALDYTDIKEIGSEYFGHDFFMYSEDEVLIDAGGYDGDTIEDFAAFTENRYKRIYSFEPDKNTGELLKAKLYKYGDKVRFYPYGLWSETTTLPFCNDNQLDSSHIVNDDTASSRIQCVKLDDIIKNEVVTFIKMDIEGAEIPALYGAKNIILKDMPKLAICIYHKPEDLWEIPLLIQSWVPDYKFYVRHYGERFYGTILFATI